MHARRTLVSWAAVGLVAGCSVYEPPGEHGDEHGDEGAPVALSDACTSEEIELMGSDESHHPTSTGGLRDDFTGFPGCGGAQLPGPDGFVRIAAAAGDRWHIEAEPEEPDLDLAIYLLPTCDALACQLLVDRCGPGWPEDFTFIADSAGEYLVGIDSSQETGGDLDLLVLRTQCGDGIVDHGESCDDGNLVAGDGCGERCRVEMAGASDGEVEPNNWHTAANVVRFGADGTGVIRIAGQLGGPCDSDHFAVHVPPGAGLYAVMMTGGEQACDDGHAPVRMTLMEHASRSVRGMGNMGGRGGACPSIEPGAAFAENLGGGEYHVMLAAEGQPEAFDYIVEIEIAFGPGG